MFPFVHLSKRPWIGPSLLMASLVLLNLTNQFPDRTNPTVAPQSDVSYLSDMESHLKSKAAEVLDRVGCQDFTVDLSLQLDTAQTTTTTYLPGEKILVADQEKLETHEAVTENSYKNCTRSQKWELTGTWTESTDVRPKIQSIRCCVTIAADQNIDHDHLYRCLSYALGIDLERGDILQIVEQ
jgi:hypothetical protein